MYSHRHFRILLAVILLSCQAAWPLSAEDSIHVVLQAKDDHVKIDEHNLLLWAQSASDRTRQIDHQAGEYPVKVSGNKIEFTVPRTEFPVVIDLALRRSVDSPYEAAAHIRMEADSIQEGTFTSTFDTRSCAFNIQAVQIMDAATGKPIPNVPVGVACTLKKTDNEPKLPTEMTAFLTDATAPATPLTASAEGTVQIPMWHDCNYKLYFQEMEHFTDQVNSIEPSDGQTLALRKQRLPKLGICNVEIQDGATHRKATKEELRSIYLVLAGGDPPVTRALVCTYPDWTLEIYGLKPGQYTFTTNAAVESMTAWKIVSGAALTLPADPKQPLTNTIVLAKR